MAHLFCNEQETVSDLFFDCCVANVFWENIAEICDKQLGADFESAAKFWLSDKKFRALNVWLFFLVYMETEE
jgi:hypothetical protein